MSIKKQFQKGDVIVIWKDGRPTNISTNMDKDRKLSKGDIFEWQTNPNFSPIKMKVINTNFPIAVEEVSKEEA